MMPVYITLPFGMTLTLAWHENFGGIWHRRHGMLIETKHNSSEGFLVFSL